MSNYAHWQDMSQHLLFRCQFRLSKMIWKLYVDNNEVDHIDTIKFTIQFDHIRICTVSFETLSSTIEAENQSFVLV